MPDISPLPDQVKDIFSTAYWRIDIRPIRFVQERIPYGNLERILRETQVCLRGWYFPHLTQRDPEIVRGTDFYGVWSNFENYEYWRFYQSANLFHLHGVREEVSGAWKEQIISEMRQHLSYRKPNLDSIGGYLSIINFLYTVTEAFEFAGRLSNILNLLEPVEIGIHLNNINGFILAAEASRSWGNFYQWNEPRLGRFWELSATEAREESSRFALEATIWFFQHFGWNEPNTKVLASEQAGFLKKRA
jgi:hypothetical protein